MFLIKHNMNKYYLHRDNQNHGPYPEEQLVELIRSGSIGAEELICLEGGSDWIAASSFQQAVVAAAPQAAAPSLLTGGPPKVQFAMVWLWIYAVGFIGGAISVFNIFSNLTHKVTGEKTGFVPGLLLALLIGFFAVAFAMIAIGLKNRKPWAHGMACRFMLLNIFSPLFIIGIIGWKKLTHKDTIAAFEVK
ncbi:MAG: DUF4339 domain-containing protein [Akkermansiaceae bacterium]